MEFPAFPSIARLNRDITITEKIDGTNGVIHIFEPQPDSDLRAVPWVAATNNFLVAAGSRSRWITPEQDNHGFARWVQENAYGLVADLGPGLHYGEWWGSGIQRGYGLQKGDKRLSLFNTARWSAGAEGFVTPGLSVVPVLTTGNGSDLNHLVGMSLNELSVGGSFASPGFMRPEGVVIYHKALNGCFKVTLEKDSEPKSLHHGRKAVLL